MLDLLCAEQRRCLSDHLKGVLRRELSTGVPASLAGPMAEMVLGGGKRLRPQLCIWTYRQLAGDGGGETPAAVLDVACTWELFHAFLLVHDDLIDAADVRRGRPTLQRLLDRPGADAGSGERLALVAGDLLFSAATAVLHKLDLPCDVWRSLLTTFSRIAKTTGLGQAMDLAHCDDAGPVTEQKLLREYHWKTAAYTFEGPMLSGAILAGLSEAARERLSCFAIALGQAYQIHNDLADLCRQVHVGSDLARRKRTVALERGRRQLKPAQRREFDRQWDALAHANGEMLTMAEALRQELLAAGAVEQTQTLIGELLEKASGAANDSAVPAALRHGLLQLQESLRRNYFATALPVSP